MIVESYGNKMSRRIAFVLLALGAGLIILTFTLCLQARPWKGIFLCSGFAIIALIGGTVSLIVASHMRNSAITHYHAARRAFVAKGRREGTHVDPKPTDHIREALENGTIV